MAVSEVYDNTWWPFEPMYDARSRTMMQRISERLRQVRVLEAHRCIHPWRDVDGTYAAHTSDGWGPWGRRYARVERGQVYFRLETSVTADDAADRWWLVVSHGCVRRLSEMAAWAPSSCFGEPMDRRASFVPGRQLGVRRYSALAFTALPWEGSSSTQRWVV